MFWNTDHAKSQISTKRTLSHSVLIHTTSVTSSGNAKISNKDLRILKNVEYENILDVKSMLRVVYGQTATCYCYSCQGITYLIVDNHLSTRWYQLKETQTYE